MKRVLCVILASGILAGSLSAAGQAETKTAAPAVSKVKVNTTGFPLVAEPVTIKVSTILIPTARNFGDMPVFQELEKLTNVKVEWNMIPSAAQTEKINLMLASRDYPDVFLHSFPSISLPQQLAKQNVVQSLSPFMATYAPNYSAMLAKYPDIKPYLVNPDGQIYSFPVYRNMLDLNSCGDRVFINTDWLKKLGLKYPQNIEEFYTVLKAFKTRDPNGNGKADEIPFSLIVGVNNDISRWIQLFGPWGVVYPTIVKGGKVDLGFTQPGFKEGLKLFRKLYAEGLLDPESFTQNQEQLRAKTTVGNTFTVGTFHNYVSWLVVDKSVSLYYKDFTDPTPNPTIIYDVLTPLAGPTGTKSWPLVNAVRNLSAMQGFVSATTKYPELAVRWVDVRMDGKEWGYSMQEGLKGTNWRINEKGFVTPNDPPAGVTRNDWRAQSSADATPLFWDSMALPQVPQYGWITQNEMAKKYEPFYDKASRFPSEYFPLAEEEEIIKRYWEGIRLYICENMVQFITGEADIDKQWDAYVAGFSRLGLPDVLKAWQGRYDRFIQSGGK